MKKLLLITLTLFAVKTMAAAKTHSEQTYEFKFQPHLGESFKYSVKAKDQFEALERAAHACFSHYKQQRQISTEEGLDLIDICVNPRSI